MFLHSGASLHGHEYSNKHPGPNNHPAPRRSPLLRAALTSTPPPTIPSASPCFFSSSPRPPASAAAAAALATSTTTTRAAASPANPIVRSASVTNGLQARSASAFRPKTHHRHISEGSFDDAHLPEPLVRFQEPVVDATPQARLRTPSNPTKTIIPASDVESDYSGSEDSYLSEHATNSVVSSKNTRRRRPPRKSTTYLFAHPAPKLRTKKQLLTRIRPTLIVQLQQVSPNRRPMPVIDVYPSSLIAGNVVAPRFSKRFPRLFGVNGELGLHDTILVRSDDYDSHPNHHHHHHHLFESDTEDDSNLDHRSLLAVLSPARHDKQTEIVLEDGTVWKASRLPTGSYDFVHVDEHGFTSTVRWVRRCNAKSASLSSAGANSPDGAVPEKEPKFTFSIIDPQSRRHPVLATLTKSTLNILDHYTTVTPLSSRYPPSTSHTQSTIDEEDESGTDSTPPTDAPLTRERTVVQVDDALRDFISVTAIWVLLRFGLGETPAGCVSNHGTPINGTSGSQRRASGSFRRRRSPPLTDRSQSPSPDAKLRQTPPSPTQGDLPRTPSLPTKPTSTGAAFVQRHKQLHLSDTASETGRRSFSGVRRSKTLSRFSGDFTTMAGAGAGTNTRKSPSPTGSVPAPETAPWAGTPSSTVASAKVRRHLSTSAALASRSTMPSSPSAPVVTDDVRRSKSTNYHGPSSAASSAARAATARVNANEVKHGRDAVRSMQPNGSSADGKRGSSSKWKKLGHWFKRIGSH